MIPRSESTSEFQPLEDKEVEYFFASDASAVIEHTNRVIFLEVSVEKNINKRIRKFKKIYLGIWYSCKPLTLLLFFLFNFFATLQECVYMLEYIKMY